MSNVNQLQYFASQTYRQVQLSVTKGKEPYSYSDFARQFNNLLETSGDEAFSRHLTVELVEEAAKHNETTDYLRQEITFETQPLTLADRHTAIISDQAHPQDELAQRRSNRQTERTTHSIGALT